MQLVSSEIRECLTHSSGIRKMFEAGLELKQKFGADNVFDYSLGNPDLPPPAKVEKSLEKIAVESRQPFSLGYMSNAGYPAAREKLASLLTAEQGIALKGEHIVITCGAAGGINVFFRTVLTRGEEVITPCPYFVEYGFYVGNSGGKLVPVPSVDFTFEPDVDRLAAAINEKTRAIILNSPHNPTGQIYTSAHYQAIARAVNAAEEKYGKPIYIVADEPYRFLNFDGAEIPSVFRYFRHSVVIGSFSKSLSLAGERIGYIAVSPDMAGADELVNGLIFCNRILGFVNAPAIAQKILLDCATEQVDLDIYRRRRDVLARALTDAGIRFTMPRGAFYFFPQSPVPDESVFVRALIQEHVLAVAGSSFGTPGYIRMAFCSVSEEMIRKSAPALKRAAEAVRK
ncbi:MAG: pyridoxal phosphate-dependent aminotransferase [Lentisphaeria bacterium]|nr:pyridoxal phosphate-dependent aminotransferase [Lentisphaeria bacterium]